MPSTSSRPVAAAPGARRYDLDWVRIVAFGLLILYHVGMYYVSWDWHVKSPQAGTVLEPLMWLTSPWRLALLFFVSGAATALLLQRRRAGFFATRSRRLLLPLVFGMLVIVVPQAYCEVVEKLGYSDGYLAFWSRYLRADHGFCKDGHCLDLPTWNHLWFVAYLWVYTAVLALTLRCAPRTARRLRDRLAQHLTGLGALAWPVLALAVWRLTLIGRFPATHALVDDWYDHALYGSCFLLGCALATSAPFWDALRGQRWLSLGAAVGSTAFLVWYFQFAGFSDTHPVPTVLLLFQRTVFALAQWTAIAAVLGFARHIQPGDSAARRYLTQAVFPFYIVHQTVIVVLAHGLKPLALPPAVEGPLLVLATAAACVLSFEAVRRVRWLRPLFGLGAAASPGVAAERYGLCASASASGHSAGK